MSNAFDTFLNPGLASQGSLTGGGGFGALPSLQPLQSLAPALSPLGSPAQGASGGTGSGFWDSVTSGLTKFDNAITPNQNATMNSDGTPAQSDSSNSGGWFGTRAITIIIGLILIAGGIYSLANSAGSGILGNAGLAIGGGARSIKVK